VPAGAPGAPRAGKVPHALASAHRIPARTAAATSRWQYRHTRAVTLGRGTPLFHDKAKLDLELLESKAFNSGAVYVRYQVA
jgi:hypothetical protein